MTARAIVSAAGLLLLGLVTLGPEARAEVRDGSFVGTIRCDALPSQRALKTKVTMTVAEGRARYEREIQHPTGGPSGNFERGEGPVTPTGDVTVATKAIAPGYSYEAEYRGRVEESTARLAGNQRWKIRNESGTIVRPSSLELMRAAP